MTEPEPGLLADHSDDAVAGVVPSRQPRRGARHSAREPSRNPSRSDQVVKDRQGNILTRTRQAGVDPFSIPPNLVPQGWTYQWNTVTIYGNKDIAIGQSMAMYQNGWRPVPAERHDGMFVPFGTKGEIIRDGMRLEERPAILTEEARAEDEAEARKLMRDRDQSLMGGKANLRNSMGQGFEMSSRYRGSGGDLRMSVDRSLDLPPPGNYAAADDSIA